MNRTPLRDVLDVTKALSDGQRLRVLMLLQAGELCVCQIVEVLQLATSTVSKHLSVLTAAGLVNCRKEGRWAYYRIAEQPDATDAAVWNWARNALKRDPTIVEDAATLARVKKIDLEIICRQQRKN